MTKLRNAKDEFMRLRWGGVQLEKYCHQKTCYYKNY